MEKLPIETNIKSLRSQLENAGINISNWGTGKAKTIEHLQKEIEEGETVLTTNENGELIRNLNVVSSDIYYISKEGKQYRLKEEKQVFQDGRERKRGLEYAISEKIKADEDPEKAIIRGIEEELGIEGDIKTNKIEIEINTIESPSYPGLKTEYNIHKFKTILNEKQFNPNGYIERQDGLTTFFVWEEIK